MRVLFFVVHFLIPFILHSQASYSDIRMVGKVAGDDLLIRWAPTTSEIWSDCNSRGYTLERYVITDENGVLADPKPVLLVEERVPYELPKWEQIKDDNFAMIAAQAIFNEDIKLTVAADQDPVGAYQLSRQTDLRFSFALLSADRSLKAAEYSGLFCVDSSLTFAKRVYYKVSCKTDVIEYSGDLLVDRTAATTLPKIDSLYAIGDNGTIALKWQSPKFYQYSYYTLYRAENGGAFEVLNSSLVNTSASTDYTSNTFVDTLVSADRMYQYKVAGVDLFGEEGPGSLSSPVQASDNLSLPLAIEGYRQTEDGLVRVRITEVEHKDSIMVEIADHEGSIHQVVRTPVADDDSISLVLEQSAYITAVSGEEGERRSLPYYIHIPDQNPPDVPQVIAGSADSMNRVKLQWQTSDSDLRGVRVFRAFGQEGPYVQITSAPVLKDSLIDSLGLSLTRSAYYKVQAEDINYNRSAFSDQIVVKLNSAKIQTQPISNFEIVGDTIWLHWMEHPQFISYLVYRVAEKGLDTLEVAGHSLNDVPGVGTFSYVLIGVDGMGALGAPSDTLHIELNGKVPILPEFSLKADRSQQNILIEVPEHQKIARLEVYRALKGVRLRLREVYQSPEQVLIDGDLRISNTYRYRFKVTYHDGEIYFTPPMEIDY